MKGGDRELEHLWRRHAAEWRDTAQVASQWREAASVDPRLLECQVSRGWWDLIEGLGVTLLITREYEHLVIAMSAAGGRPRLSFFPLPHPSGLTIDRQSRRVYVASTRNPNQVFTLKPATGNLERLDMKPWVPLGAPLLPVAVTYYPGCMYMHDLALIGRRLHANAVGHNAVVQLGAEGSFERVWWPRCMEVNGKPVFGQNHIQLNSIAAGNTLKDSFFSASAQAMGRLRPGHLNYPLNGRGVIFSGRTREPICTGLTRPHSARLRDLTGGTSVGGKPVREIWVANSGYGELGYVRDGRLEVVSRLPGWTRGLCVAADVAFTATSRVIPKFAGYAPGLEISQSRCAVHAVSMVTGKTLASLEWPYGNQVFAIDWIANRDTQGFVFGARSRRRKRETAFFYSYLTGQENHGQ